MASNGVSELSPIVGVAGVQSPSRITLPHQYCIGDDLHKSYLLGDQGSGARMPARLRFKKSSAVPDFSFARLPPHIPIHQLYSAFFAYLHFIHTHKMANEDPTTYSAGVESDLSHKEKMSDDNPTAQRLEMASDASQKEKTAGTVDLFDIPDPDAHLSEAERKAIVCSSSTKKL